MLRLLFLIAIVALVALIVVKLVKGVSKAPPAGAGEPPDPVEAKLVRCGNGGAFVPRTDARPAPDGSFRCTDPGCREGA